MLNKDGMLVIENSGHGKPMIDELTGQVVDVNSNNHTAIENAAMVLNVLVAGMMTATICEQKSSNFIEGEIGRNPCVYLKTDVDREHPYHMVTFNTKGLYLTRPCHMNSKKVLHKVEDGMELFRKLTQEEKMEKRIEFYNKFSGFVVVAPGHSYEMALVKAKYPENLMKKSSASMKDIADFVNTLSQEQYSENLFA